MAEIIYCQDSALLYHPHIEGRIVIQFTINKFGRVAQSGVQSTDFSDPMLANCVLKKTRDLAIPNT
jgi:hypothetical protein